MKTIIVAASIFGSSLLSGTNPYGSVNMGEKIQELIRFENGILPLNDNEPEFVRVSFKLNDEGKVQILEMNYSDELIKDELVKKLSELKVVENHKVEEVYNYNFTFKKI